MTNYSQVNAIAAVRYLIDAKDCVKNLITSRTSIESATINDINLIRQEIQEITDQLDLKQNEIENNNNYNKK